MSDKEKDNASGTESKDNSFTPDPAPPQIKEQDDSSEKATEMVKNMPDSDAKRAFEAVQLLVENNKSSSEQLEGLMSIVLDAAEVANRSATQVVTTGGQLHTAANKLVDGAIKNGNLAKLILALTAAVLIGTAGTFSFMSVTLHNKVEQLDEMLLAVGKRAVDLKLRMESMDDINTNLAELTLQQENTQSVQFAIEQKIADIMTFNEKKLDTTPKKITNASNFNPNQETKKINQKIDRQNKDLTKKLTNLNSLLSQQTKAVKEITQRLNGLQKTSLKVDDIKKDVESIARLQQRSAKKTAKDLAEAKAQREKDLLSQKEAIEIEREKARKLTLAKEKELQIEREFFKQRELAREKILSKEKALAQQLLDAETQKAKDRALTYKRDQSKPNANAEDGGKPAYFNPDGDN